MVGERHHSDAELAGAQTRASPRLAFVVASANVTDTCLVEHADRLAHPFDAEVQDVVVRQDRKVDAGGAQRPNVIGLRTEVEGLVAAIVVPALPAAGQRALEVAKNEIRSVQEREQAAPRMRRPRPFERPVHETSEHDVAGERDRHLPLPGHQSANTWPSRPI
jgi:hypothetical protein